MRLSNFELKIIKESVEKIFGNDTKVFLFGSRINDKLKGGDIDIYLEVSGDDNGLLEKKLRLLVELEKKLGEQKIDIIINNNSNYKLIYEVAQETGVQL